LQMTDFGKSWVAAERRRTWKCEHETI
jgi:hypothetical protein